MSKAKKLPLSYHIDYGAIELNDGSNRNRYGFDSGQLPDIIYKNENLQGKYKDLFEAAIDEYNLKQKRADRKKSLFEVIQPKRERAFREVVIRFGNSREVDKNVCFEAARNALNDYYLSFEERNPCLKVFSAVMYLEDMPRLHIDFIPICHGHKYGISPAVSFKGALAEQGFYSKNQTITEQMIWAENERKHLSALISKYGFKREYSRK